VLSVRQFRAIEIVARIAESKPGADFYWSRLRTAPVEGHVTISDLIDAHELCLEAGILAVGNDSVCLSDDLASLEPDWRRRLAILDSFWTIDPPPWLSSGSVSQLLVLLPENDRAVLEWTEADVADREAFLLGMARKADPIRQIEVGNFAEELVVERYKDLLSMSGGGKCERVSLVSDQLGYDLLVTTVQGSIRVEVKAAAGLSLLRVFLSRNEAEVAARIATWRMVVCVGPPESGQMRIAGHLLPSDLDGRLPTDPESGGSWEECRLVLPTQVLHPELPLP
jgi:hypothetical protein